MNPAPDPVNLTELMNTHAPSLHRYAARLICDADAARDIVQQVFIRLSQLGESKRPAPATAKSWLYRCTHNLAVDTIRADQRRKRLHEEHAHLQKINQPETHAHKLDQVLRLVDRLDEKQRAVLLLRLQEGLSYREIAETTGLKEGHVGYLLHHAVSQLTQWIQGEEPA
jgi:RNA polymerase sigma-70 factor (ECF subfamily)